ncbi:hypothetical protein OG730_26715 [Streptomyces sp. NBC_01298]|uniref:hypothetical protein n=1 Tax=Streptomyces sp. NBC_01298 TaxID=2903817 RepID=UPI002E118706|nr:hypothetical protein OG730_26715 [Streptomyces sp. NBC_01298]
MGNRTTRGGLKAAGTLLAALALTAPPQTAAAAARAAPAPVPEGAGARCTPSVQVLEKLPGAEDPHPSPWVRRTEVTAIAPGPARLAVGMSGYAPAYWVGTKVFAVPLPAGSNGAGRVLGVNRHGLMAGELIITGEGSRAFSYRVGAAAVTLLPGGDSAVGVNDRGVIVGRFRDETRLRTVAVRWSGDGRVRRELPAPAGSTFSLMAGVNNAGQVAGNAYVPHEGFNYGRGVLWPADPAAAPALLATGGVPTDRYTVLALDESGRAVGRHRPGGDGREHGVVWRTPDGPPADAPLASGSVGSSFEDVSPATGVTVGVADFSYPYPGHPDLPGAMAEYWTGSGPMRVLPGIGGVGNYSTAYAVSDDDRVGGAAQDALGAVHPVIWTCAARQAHVLPGDPGPRPDPL